jgi:hypothetical protein
MKSFAEKAVTQENFMSDDDAAMFMEITQCDRVTALFCLRRHSNNLQQALSFFFDAGLTGVQAPAAAPADPSVPRPSADWQPPPQPSFRPPPTVPAPPRGTPSVQIPGPRPAPLPSPLASASRSARDPESYKRDDPPIFLPFGPRAPGMPAARQYEAPASMTCTVKSPADLFRDAERRTVECIIWKNGISIDGQFFRLADDRKCRAAMKQIQRNTLPTALSPDLKGCDLNLIIRKSVAFQG